MISTDLRRVQVKNIVENQLPSFVREDFPLITEFIKQYYVSQEYPGAPVDLIQNIDQYLKLESILDNTDYTELSADISFSDTTINVKFDTTTNIFGTYKFPEKYGLIQIDDEIILYTGKTNTSFTGCVRGFSGVTSYQNPNNPDTLVFSESQVANHTIDSKVKNLSSLFLVEFLEKIKYQFTPGFENRQLSVDLNKKLFISRVKDFYSSKGTDSSFKILFNALYGEDVEVIKPKDNLFRPSDAEYRVTNDIVVESISGNPLELLNNTLYQDEYENYGISKSYGSVTDVEKISIDGRYYYKLSLDYDYSKDINLIGSVYGKFSVHPKTKIITQVSSGSSTIDVDSTVGFPNSGELFVNYNNGNSGIVSYKNKSNNQFFDVTNIISDIDSKEDIRLNVFAYGYSGISTSNPIEVRIGSVLSDLKINDKTYYYSKNDSATIKTLGITTESAQTTSWIYNIAIKYDVKNYELIDSSDFTYKITTYDKHNFQIGDSLIIAGTSSEFKNSKVTAISNEYAFLINGQGELKDRYYTVERKLLKPNLSSKLINYSYINNFNTNIQNTYVKFNNDTLVSSSSLPNYFNQSLNFYDRKLNLNGSYNGTIFNFNDILDHGYYTGDAVYYTPSKTIDSNSGLEVSNKFSNMQEGIYYIKRINANQFNIATSPANLYNEKFISVSGIVTSNTFEYVDYANNKLQHQRLLREIKSPNNESGVYDTQPGCTGILINGVEIVNYKSEDAIKYGGIDSIEVFSPGRNYDVINPPILSIQDELGIGATAKCSVKGNLVRIDILDAGFDYVSFPIVTINGGNGVGAKAEVNTTFISHSVSFNTTIESNFINLSNNTIGFSTYHKFRNAEEISYKSDGQVAISGLTTDSNYCVNVVDAHTVKLHRTKTDAISGINTVDITSYSTGIHRLQSVNKKQIISNIVVSDSGTGYENKERTTSSVGINTSLNQINISNHDYKSGEIVTYSNTDTPVSGLSTSNYYVVTKVDNNNFKLSNIGVSSVSKYFYYDTKQYINLQSVGSGSHIFNYESISVTIIGEIGISTISGQDFSAKIQPIFRGVIDSTQVTNSGIGYGSPDILNYDRQPLITLSSGSGSRLLPIVNDGKIVEVLIISSGSNYNSPPDLVIEGVGKYAKLVPIISEGKIISVRIDNSGIGYDNKTAVNVITPGLNAAFKANIQKWTVNLFQKYFDIISDDDGILKKSINEDFGIEYCHLYAPRKLRESIYGKTADNNIKYGIFDLQKNSGGNEIASDYHSPIIGWAYDGNPIYGPYGFSTKTGGSVRAMQSGYKLTTKINRPPFAQGFFIEDYEFDNSGDLDEHNGRFCKTPEFPMGTYAYFATVNSDSVDSSGTFAKYRQPTFPYLVGNTFKSKPNPFNFDKTSNQNSYNLNRSDWFRNTKPYNLTENNSYYDFLFQPNKSKNLIININEISKGSIEAIGIVTGGNNYQVNDSIIFDSTQGTSKATAKISKILGKEVTNISVASTAISNIEFIPLDSYDTYIGFATYPHKLLNFDLVSISGLNTSILSFQNSFNVGVSSNIFILNTGIGSTGVTGIVTYFNISGQVSFPQIVENDILTIDGEQIKVLNVDSKNSRIRALRKYNGTQDSAHSALALITENTRKFTFKTKSQNNTAFNLNREIYFNPIESLGLGSVSGVGIGTTIYFSNPGAGVTQIFIPTQSIYIPNHELKTGDVLTYSANNEGSSIGVSTNGTTSFSFDNQSNVYVAKISNDLIGISTFKVGVGTTGTFVGIASTTSNKGLLYFTGIGTGVYHSFKTIKQNVVVGEANKNIVTVATAATHGLSINDVIDLSVKPFTTSTIVVKYNDYNRRIVFNPKSFGASDVSVSDNTITLTNHGYITGDKVIHTSSSPSGGLINEEIYYIVYYTKDKIKLSNTLYQSKNQETVDISSASLGTISAINPLINVYKNNQVKFDLSDTSLSFTNSSTLYSAFELYLYEDKEFKNVFDSSKYNSSFEVSKIGYVGITSNASLILSVSDYLDSDLYYKFNLKNANLSPSSKKEIVIDDEVLNYNQIKINNSNYSGKQTITGIGITNTFTFNLNQYPESSSYSIDEASIIYSTNSTSVFGSISDIKITYGGRGYSSVDEVSTIKTNNGFGALLTPSSTSIGSITSYTIQDIGFDYPTDNTLRPVCNLPEILFIDPLTSFSEIGITSSGKNYSITPNLIVLDGYTNKVVNDVELKYNVGDTKVQILQNTFGIYNVTPKIIPISNCNGIGIKSISYNSSTNEVTVGLNTGFSDYFPFSTGDKVLIENISVGVGSTGKGYNSSEYGYDLFTLTKVPAGNSALGGNVGVVTYSLSNYLNSGEIPGNFDAINSSGRIIAEKDFPVFNVKLKKNDFSIGESVRVGNNYGLVDSWNNKINLLKVSTSKDFKVDDIIIGKTSRTQGVIKNKIDFNAEIMMDSSSIVKKGWNKESGFLNYNTERMSDNDYYQNFSYSLKSKISLDKWDDSVSSLNHPSGFLKFSNLIIESKDDNFGGVFVDSKGSDIDVTVDIYNEIDLNCYPNFDLVTENSLTIGNRKVSDEIYFNSRVLTDYYESFGNRVLTIDDISNQFNSQPRSTKFSVVDIFNLESKYKKYFTYVRDKRFTGERQFSIVSLLHDEGIGYINQYGKVESQQDLGSFDFDISGAEGLLLFYPTKYSVNNYDISHTSIDILNAISGVGTTSFGDVVSLETTNVFAPASTATTIVSIATTFRTSKVLVEIDGGNNGQIQINEVSLIHNGTDVEFLEYGQVTNHSLDGFGSSGLGTYNAYISSGKLNLDFTPNVGMAATINTVRVSLSSTMSTGIGTQYISISGENITFIDSSYVSIASTSVPIENIITKYPNISPNEHSASYFIVSVEDLTNNRYQMSEVIVIDDGTNAYATEYGNLETYSSLGTIGAAVSTSGYTNLTFTPNANINTQVRTFQIAMQIADEYELGSTEILLNNAKIAVGYGFYQGTETDVKRAFDLKSNQRQIFKRDFNGGSANVVNITDDTIIIPEHYFVTGEKVLYSHAGAGTTQAIGIGTTAVGIGTTDKLPSEVYIVKVNEQKVKLSASAEDALKSIPKTFNITNVGIGTSHTFTTFNQNGKCLICLDNFIQSPIVATSVTTGLSTHIGITDNIIKFSGITSFFGGDLIKINDEIMRINSVGLGSTNYIAVERPWMGTGLSTHSEYSTVTKVQGNYNIVDNTINFITAPYGRIPIGSSTNAPDERDWSGITTNSRFQGRTFLKSGQINSLDEAYSKNYIFDDISEYFDAKTKTFTLKSQKQNISGFSTNNSIILINGVFQGPTGLLPIPQDYGLIESSGITSITFTGTATSVRYDANNANIPVGGIIVSVASTEGFGYQPVVAAGGTAVVSIAGTISSISIGNSGSGYRSGIQQIVRVGVVTSSNATPNIKYVGIASISNGNIVSVAITNPGIGYTISNPPLVIFDNPLNYSDIPLIYSSSSPLGFGTEATIDIVVGQGSSVINFEIKNTGYSYRENQILTVSVGGTTGIPLDSSKIFKEFQITINKTISNQFSGWNVGELEVLDKIENQFDGIKKSFTISKNDSPLTIRSAKGSAIDIQSTILVFLNDILQVPGEAYTFKGGSVITFIEAPKGASDANSGDKCKILFYKGNGDVDVVFKDTLPTIKVGDNLTINDEPDLCQYSIQEEERLVTEIISSDTVQTNPYDGAGITDNPLCTRPVTLCVQSSDKIINGKIIGKNRVLYEPLINPTTNIIQSVGVGSTVIFVESVRTFFDSIKENATTKNKQSIVILSQDSIVAASATAVVSYAGTISSIVISSGGVGYSTNPTVSIADPVGYGISTPRTTYTTTANIPVGLGTTATATASISIGGTVSSITVNNSGAGYTSSNPPQVLIEIPKSIYETNTSSTYEGDFGLIVGIKTTSVGVASTALIFDLYIPQDSYLRNSSITGVTTVSGIQTGYYFVVNNTNVGNGVTSLYQNNSILGIGTQFLNGIYEVASVSIAQTSIPGIALTYVTRVTTSISNYNSLSGIGNSAFYGEFSWGKITLGIRNNPKTYNSYTRNGILGITTSSTVTRISPLKYVGYSSL
jgi:hypothetical protein